MTIWARRTFAAFSIYNFRLFFAGQVISHSGTWMQRVAQAWLVLELTNSGTAVGAATAAQFLPLLLLAPIGGLIADRVERRRLLILTQILSAVIGLTLGVLVLLAAIQLWMVFVLAFALGVVTSVDNPARNSFFMEMVGPAKLANAVALNAVLSNSARVIGPALAGFLIVTLGIGWCFVINAATFLFFIAAIAFMRPDEIARSQPEMRARGQLKRGLSYVRGHPVLRATMVVIAVVGLLSYEFEVVLPLLARFTYGGSADTLGLMFACLGIGAIGGGLLVASWGRATPKMFVGSVMGLGASLLAIGIAPALPLTYVALIVAGGFSSAFITLGNSVLQLESVPTMQGRVIGIRAVAFLGLRPVGAPIVGWIGERFGPRYSLGLGALAALAVALWARRRFAATKGIPSHSRFSGMAQDPRNE